MASNPSHPAVDLHLHSTASDGTVAPVAILSRAAAAGLRAISLTDHDTVDGVREIYGSTIPPGLAFIGGVEISAALPPDFPGKGSLHILGYGIDIDHPVLNRSLARLQSARAKRNPGILAKLAQLGITISLEALLERSGGGQAGRPHIAELLVENGHAASVDDAFDRFLGAGKPAYVDKFRIPCREAIGTIHAAGGVAVLAHPGLVRTDGRWSVPQLIETLAAIGLDGIEVYYPEHSPAQTAAFLALCESRGLVATGGTDFHGSIKPEIGLGTAPGGFTVPLSCFQQLSFLLRQRKASTLEG